MYGNYGHHRNTHQKQNDIVYITEKQHENKKAIENKIDNLLVKEQKLEEKCKNLEKQRIILNFKIDKLDGNIYDLKKELNEKWFWQETEKKQINADIKQFETEKEEISFKSNQIWEDITTEKNKLANFPSSYNKLINELKLLRDEIDNSHSVSQTENNEPSCSKKSQLRQ